jgi:hypothetical protein
LTEYDGTETAVLSDFERGWMKSRNAWLWISGIVILVIWCLCQFGATLVFLVFGVIFQSTKEIARVTSPDGLVDAVMTETSPGMSMESDYYDIYLVPSGSKELSKRDRMVEGTNLEDSRITWIGPRLLEIPYADACIDKFFNGWCSDAVQNCDYVVEVRLIPPADSVAHQCKD